MRRVGAGAVSGLLVLLAAAGASAHGRFPAANEILFSPSNPALIVTRTTFALLPSTDEGATWSYLCLESLGLSALTYQDPEIAFTANGTLVAGMAGKVNGLDVSSDVGCSWTCAGGPLAGQTIVDTLVRPDRPHHVVVLASTLVDGSDDTQVFESADDGTTFVAHGAPLDPTVLVTGLEVSASDPTRLYVSGVRGYGAQRTASLFTWTDGDAAAGWAEHPVPDFTMAGGESSIFMGGVDPSDPDRVYLRSQGNLEGGLSRLYVTTDGGVTIRAAKDFAVDAGTISAVSGELLGFALSPDGSRVFVGTRESGLWSASRTDLAFSLVNPQVGVQCLATRQTPSGPELWACGIEYKGPPGNPGNFIVGRSVDDGVTFDVKLPTLTSFKGISQCPAPSSGSMACEVQSSVSCGCDDYVSFCSTTEATNSCLGCGMVDDDAGADDAGPADSGAGEAGIPADAGKAPRTGVASSSGCNVVGSKGDASEAAIALGFAAAVFARKREKKGGK
ncbi:MAG: hypothetical protein ACRENE_07420 [Polyangiaceae bacterium]